MESKEKEFLEMVEHGLIKARENVAEKNEDCRTALIFMEKGKSKIKQFLSMPHQSKNVSFERSRIYEGSCNFDLRCLMDNDFINEVVDTGYSYDIEHSTSEVLEFQVLE